MLHSLFVTVCVMVTLITVAYHFYKEKDSYQSKSLTCQVVSGLYSGFSGIILMIFSIPVEATVILDFRNFAVITAALLCGPLAAVIATLSIIIYRIAVIGMSTAALVAMVGISSVCLLSLAVSARPLSFKYKWGICAVMNVLVGTVGFLVILWDSEKLTTVTSYFIIGTLVASLFLYFLLQYYLDFHSLHNKLKNESVRDFLTGLNNVRAFDIEFNKITNRVTRSGEEIAFLLLDIDHFKRVNDTHGHSSGDLVLRDLANLLRETCRDFDIISRNGGEEFSVILQDCPQTHALVVAERIRRAVETTSFTMTDGKKIHITLSIGIASYPENAPNPDEIITLADKALYHAKRTGRNKSVLYEPFLGA